ncbi:hypothetical protein Misp01_16000 [Microtetraspora sp. NBRC 13810]|uniref:hypothetical protein n=1 Tax=Microtetraspora sp. NBRC 13810 TaxID=3030990 RepID=UPI00249FBDFA|nr:hypothetical protein [Microtetraspora sp. NBRC 13810]GLW06470.1 hypothetical protein Misp01_16000 [Microtetraspora sp. NBRC 13810]
MQGPPPQWQQRPPERRRRTGLWVTLGVLSLVLVVAVGAGVGLVLRGGGAAGPAPERELAAAATGGADPQAVVVSDEEINALMAAHGRALAAGDAKQFTSIFDQKNTALVREQSRVFANLRKVPMIETSYQVLRRVGRAEDNFGRGVKFEQDVAFVHRIAGIDLRPVTEWYRWTIEKASAGAPLVVTKVGGAPPPFSAGGGSKTVYYPGPWDIWPDISLVQAGSSIILARPQDAALARRIAPTVAGATSDVRDFWQRSGEQGAPVPAGFVVALADGPAQLGNLFRKEKVTGEAGVSIPMPSWGLGDDVKIGGTRIVLDAASDFFDSGQGIKEVTTHEFAHSLVASLDSAGFSLFGKPNWIIEGFAEYVANRGRPINQNLRFDEGQAYLAGRFPLPFEGRLPDNTTWTYKGMGSLNYFMGHLAIRYAAERYGERKLVGAVVAAYRADGDESESAFFQALGVGKANFERQWADYARRQLT